MVAEFDCLSLGDDTLDSSTVDSYKTVCEALVVAIRTNISSKNSNRFTDNKFNDWKIQILKDLQNNTLKPSKQILVRGVNILLAHLNLVMLQAKSGFVILRTDSLDVELDKDSGKNITEKQKEQLINNTFSYNNELALADFKIDNHITDDRLEEDGLVFLITMLLLVNGGKLRVTDLEKSLEQFIDLYKTTCGVRKLNFTEFLSNLNTEGCVKLYDGDKDLEELKQTGTHIERCIKVGPSALSEFSPIAVARFISEMKGMSFNEVLEEHGDIKKLIDKVWTQPPQNSSTQQIPTPKKPSSFRQTSASSVSRKAAKRKLQLDSEEESDNNSDKEYSQNAPRSSRKRAK